MSMIRFSYRGLDSQGAEARGTVEAMDKDDALAKLRGLEAQGLHDLSIEQVEQRNGGSSGVGQAAKPVGKQAELPLWQRLACLGCLALVGWLLASTVMPKSKPRPSATRPSATATQQANDRRLEQIMLDKFRDNGVVKVEVNGPVMAVHVTPATYRLLRSDRVEANRIMRGWRDLAAQNHGTGEGAILLYSEGHKMAETSTSWSGEVNVRWLDD